MLASISPVGEAARRSRWPVTVAFYVVGSLLGGLAVGATLGGVGQLLAGLGLLTPTVAVVVLLVAVAAGLVADHRRWLPSLRRQVDERWLTTYRGWVYGLGFGFQLGAAVFTTVTASATYVVLVGAMVTGSWWAGALVGACFGLVRSLPLLATARVRSAEALRALLRRIHARTTVVARATSGAQAAVGVGAVLLGVGVVT